jgi:hypothetical protein
MVGEPVRLSFSFFKLESKVDIHLIESGIDVSGFLFFASVSE